MSLNGIPDGYKDFLIEVRSGNVPGYSIVTPFGRNDSVLNGDWSLVSPVSPTGAFPSSGTPVRIKVSGNAADTSSGAGAREVTIVGIGTDLQEVSETIATSGASASVYTTNSFWRVYSASVSSVGTYGGNNVGNITIEHSADCATILAGDGQTLQGSYSVPIGKTAYLLSIAVMADATKAADFRLFVRENFNDAVAPMSPASIKFYFDGILGQETIILQAPGSPIPATSDIWVEARGGGANTEVSVGFQILLVDDDPGHLV